MPTTRAAQHRETRRTKNTPEKRARRILCGYSGCTKDVWIEPRTGIAHDFCGRTHATAALGTPPVPHGRCHACNLEGCEEPVYYDQGKDRVHDFCCKSHADQAIEQGQWPSSNRSSQRQRISPEQLCSLPGCSAKCFMDSRGKQLDFCGRTHAVKAREQGLLGRSVTLTPSDVERVWKLENGANVSMLKKSHSRYDGIKGQFLDAWKDVNIVPSVIRILQVRNSEIVYNRYLSYRDQLGVDAFGKPGGEVRRFHGTSQIPECAFGSSVQCPPCPNSSCALCNICHDTFVLNLAGTSSHGGRRMELRYGKGLYFSSCSSKSNDYAVNTERPSPRINKKLRVMFLCKVALGDRIYSCKEAIMPEPIVSQTIINGRYTSLVGETTATGGALNYEENVVYNAEAAIPSYIIVYEI